MWVLRILISVSKFFQKLSISSFKFYISEKKLSDKFFWLGRRGCCFLFFLFYDDTVRGGVV